MTGARGLVGVDLDGTLVDQAAAARRWVGEAVDELGLALDVEEAARALAQPRPKGPVFDQLVARYALPVPAAALWTAYRRRMPHLVTCAPETRCAFDRLRAAGWKVGIVTNGTCETQEAKIRVLGLDAHVDGWVVSESVGLRKPDLAVFEALAAHLGRPLNGWMIGDGLEHDVAGGRRAGLRTAWIHRCGAADAPEPDLVPDLVAASVAEAVDAILAN